MLPRIEVSIHKYTASWNYYYLFSPQIANHESEQQPWLQLIVKDGQDVVFAILSFATRAHFAAASTAEASALSPGGFTNGAIAAVYMRLDMVSDGLHSNLGTVCKILIAILLISMAPTILRTKLPAGCSF